MKHNQLRAFHHVALHGGFSRAADALHLTQPAISDQVRQLEQDYDTRLFDRSHRQVRLTDTGKALFDITRRIFEMEDQARALLAETSARHSGIIRIISDSAYHALHILAAFRARHPEVQVIIQRGNSEDVLRQLQSYDADLGILGTIPDARHLTVLPLSRAAIVAVTAKDAPLVATGPVPLGELIRQPLVLREAGSKTRGRMEEAARRLGLRLKPAIVAEGREAVHEIVASGAGIGFVSEAEFGHDPRLRKIRIAGPQIIMDEALIHLRERGGNRLIRAFHAVALAHAAPE